MKPIESATFTPAGDLDDTEYLVVHCRPEPTCPSGLVLLIHGLAGERYGTWGNFPKFLFEDFPELDVGLVYYPTALKLFGLRKSIELPVWAEILVGDLQDSRDRYENYFLVGHSMGGILAQAVIKRLIDAGDSKTLSRVKGLFLMATPQAGSLHVPGFLKWFSPDLRALRAHGPLVTSLHRTFRDRVRDEPDPRHPEIIGLPTFAVTAAHDRWVDKLASSLGQGGDQHTTVEGTHTSIVKPATRGDRGYSWVATQLDRLSEAPPEQQDAEGEPAPAQGEVTPGSEQDMVGVPRVRPRRPSPEPSEPLGPPQLGRWSRFWPGFSGAALLLLLTYARVILPIFNDLFLGRQVAFLAVPFVVVLATVFGLLMLGVQMGPVRRFLAGYGLSLLAVVSAYLSLRL